LQQENGHYCQRISAIASRIMKKERKKELIKIVRGEISFF